MAAPSAASTAFRRRGAMVRGTDDGSRDEKPDRSASIVVRVRGRCEPAQINDVRHYVASRSTA